MKNSLGKKGLSMSQAQSISNLCNQRVLEIDNFLSTVNNCSKEVDINGTKYYTQKGVPFPEDVVKILNDKAELVALQAFLMENIKGKESLISKTKLSTYKTSRDVPDRPKKNLAKTESEVTEEWGWDQLSLEETNEFIYNEAMAATIGKFIHKDSKLDSLRRELPKIPSLEWLKNSPTEASVPVIITAHHTSERLLTIHENLAAKYREYISKVNYYKAKVKNLVANKNAEIAKENADSINKNDKEYLDLLEEYKIKIEKFNSEEKENMDTFEEEKRDQLRFYVNSRIIVDPRYQKLIDELLTKEVD